MKKYLPDLIRFVVSTGMVVLSLHLLVRGGHVHPFLAIVATAVASLAGCVAAWGS